MHGRQRVDPEAVGSEDDRERFPRPMEAEAFDREDRPVISDRFLQKRASVLVLPPKDLEDFATGGCNLMRFDNGVRGFHDRFTISEVSGNEH